MDAQYTFKAAAEDAVGRAGEGGQKSEYLNVKEGTICRG